MNRTIKRLFLVRNLPIFIEASDEMEALMMFEEAALKVQSSGFDGIVEVTDGEILEPSQVKNGLWALN